jgi:dUTP pyrophosphatase
MKLLIKKLHADARMPTYAHATDAGMDVYAVEDVVVPSGGRVLVSTGIAVAIPPGYVGLFWDKSGLANKSGLKILGGVIDADYRGELLVGVLNTSDVPHQFQKGDKVTQMLVQKVEHPELVEVDELNDTSRGEGAFGSTGR